MGTTATSSTSQTTTTPSGCTGPSCDQFRHEPSKGIVADNKVFLTGPGLTADTCVQACADRLWCRSAGFAHTGSFKGLCWLSDKSDSDANVVVDSDPDEDLYIKIRRDLPKKGRAC